MKRGLPKDESAGRAARSKRSASASARSSGRSAAPWWQSPLLWLVMLASVPAVNPHIRSDGNEYYAYVRSIVIDHDLRFDNEYDHAEPTFKLAEEIDLTISPSGYRRNIATIGPSLLWSPFFLAAHAGVHIAQTRGSQIPADGFSWPYVWACAFGTAFYAFLGLWMSYRLAMRFAAPPAALLATIVVWLASSVPVYVYFLPFHAHAMGLFSVALVLTMWLSIRDGRDTRGRWFMWGMAGGLAIITYYLNGVVLIVALAECLIRLGRPRGIVQALTNGLVFLAGLAVLVAPALAIKGLIEGSWFATGYHPMFFWTSPRLVETAFSTQHGVFLWTPVLLLAVVGLLVAIRRQPFLGSMLLVSGALFFYAVASYYGWHGYSSYGSRFMVSLTPIFVCGLAALVDALVGRRGRVAWVGAAAVGVLAILWNFGLMLQWGTNIIPNRGPVDFRQAVTNQVTIVPRAAAAFVVRYFQDRRALVHEVEQGDLDEHGAYRAKR